jgi:hypothetical protein
VVKSEKTTLSRALTGRPTRFDLLEPALVFGAFLVAAWILPLFPHNVLLQSIVGAGAVVGLGWSLARKKDSLAVLGLRLDNLVSASAVLLLITAILLAPAYWLDPDAEIEIALGKLFGYFLWALFQQFLVVAGFWRNFRGHALPTALAFSLAHAPNFPLMALVLVAETLWLVLFARFRNLFGLALAHAFAAVIVGELLVPEWLSSLRVGIHYLE